LIKLGTIYSDPVSSYLGQAIDYTTKGPAPVFTLSVIFEPKNRNWLTKVQAMQRNGVRRLVCLSTLGVGDSRANMNFYWKYIMFGMLLHGAFADHVSQEKHVIRSGLDWTIVRPATYTDGERTGNYRHGFSATAKALKLKISRADVAGFVLT